MSAYIVTDETISAMLQAIKYDRQGVYVYWNGASYRITHDNLQETGQKLLDENFRSIAYHYDGRISVERRQYVHRPIRQLEAVEIIKACNGYDYQACETPDWRQTEAFAIYDYIRNDAIRALPGYEEAGTWELYEKDLQ